ncbi:hypothetical protein WJX74_000078 [Apatococcus lobatus]|uniref:Uncharacterized protein n=1 Tax=Apatococcus lobatus TaxID=904363 RepID=A0AAW1QIT3_9CHLO
MSEDLGTTLAGAPANADTPALAILKKKKNRGNIRKRPRGEEEPDDAIAVALPAAKSKPGKPAFTTKKAEDEKLETFKFASSKTLQQLTDQGATRTLETETQTDRDARALREQVLAQGQAEGGDASTYRGMNNYIDYKKGFRRENTIGAEKGSGSHGPLRASSHIRTTVRFDYQPDVCKDYKETGFCGYGDSCKFVHDRSDYKSGWELEKQWDEEQKVEREKKLAKWQAEVDSEQEAGSGSDSDDDLPFACYICRRPWEECQDPVVTRCKHYFCEQCALKQNAKMGKCFVCEQTTNGIFNVAHDIAAKSKARKLKQSRAE